MEDDDGHEIDGSSYTQSLSGSSSGCIYGFAGQGDFVIDL
jgi:hypothetical protein